MSLFSQGNTRKSITAYLYIAIGTFSSLLILFLVRQSLPLDRKQAKQYYQNIKTAKQKIGQLEKSLMSFDRNVVAQNADINLQLRALESALEKLQNIPDFLNKQQTNIIKSQLETQKALLDSQSNLIQQYNNDKASLSKSCSSLTNFKNQLTNNPQLIDKDLDSSSQILISVGDLLSNVVLYCYGSNLDLASTISTQIQQINILLSQPDYKAYSFAVLEIAGYGENVIEQREKIENRFQKIELDLIENKLDELDSQHLSQVEYAQERISNYRILTVLMLLLIVVILAYVINSNLAKTNRNIVKTLENFTQELETKVEQRTAQLEASIQNTETALTQAQNANKAKSRFLANMSHELRTPLNAILGFTQLMCRDSSISQEHQENIQIINRSGEHLLKLINDILEMSKIEVGQITLNEAKFDLYIMLKSIEEMLRLKAKAKNISLNFKIPKSVPQYIFADEGKLRQIIINLLGNALKFTEKGSITLSVELKESSSTEDINIDFLFADTYCLYFSIEDTGPGIAVEERSQLFSPFEQTKTGRISNEGTGLGLSICHKFVELMGGELKVESTVGKGSTFFFEILIKLEDAQVPNISSDGDRQELRRAIAIASNQPQYKILAVDDVPASRLLLQKMLTNIGFAVKEAGDGQEAVNVWSSWQPDLILMDMRMPVMDGYEATGKIKSQPQGKKTIIIALTASAFEEERVAILSAGCDDFMRKPFYETELVAKIGQYLNIEYIYEEIVETTVGDIEHLAEITKEDLAVMSLEWRSQLYDAAAKVDDREILQLLSEIPQEYESLAKGLENLVEHFRCDKIIDLTESLN